MIFAVGVGLYMVIDRVTDGLLMDWLDSQDSMLKNILSYAVFAICLLFSMMVVSFFIF